EDEQRWVSDAEVAEIGFTAFTSRRKAEHVTARLIVRRVRRLNPATAPTGQGHQAALFVAYLYHAVITASGQAMLAAEAPRPPHRRSCICPLTGPGNPASTNYPAAPCTTHSPSPPDHRPHGPDRRPQWNSRTDRHLHHAHPGKPQREDQLDVIGKINGGSRLR